MSSSPKSFAFLSGRLPADRPRRGAVFTKNAFSPKAGFVREKESEGQTLRGASAFNEEAVRPDAEYL